MRNLLVCLDGTWNVVDHTTNVWRLYALAAASDCTGNPQIKYYGVGVGSKWYNSLTDDVGRGIS